MPMRAIAFLLLAMLLFAIQDALFKQLTQSYPVVQLLLIRMSLVVATLTLVAVLKRKTISLRTSHGFLMYVRGAVAFSAFTLYYLALQRIPLAEGATVLMSAPLFVTALSVPLLGEQVGVHRWVAVLVGFGAVLFMLRPGAGMFQPVMLLPLLSAILYSLVPILTRRIRAEENAFVITFFSTVSYLGLCILAALLVHLVPASESSGVFYTAFAEPWNPITKPAALLLTATAGLFCVSIVLVTYAYRLVQASAIASFEYFYLVWAMIIGYLIFDELPGVVTFAAAAVIAGCGIYISWRERQLNIERVAAQDAEIR